MNPFFLLQKLREYLEPRLKTLPLAVYGRNEPALKQMRPCKVFIGSMPPTQQDAIALAPFILLQAMDGEGAGFTNIRVAIRLCIVADEPEAAENDLMNLLSEIRLWLFSLPEGVLGKVFRLLPDDGLPFERPDEQVRPFLQAHIFSRWQTPGARPAIPRNMADYE